MGSLLILATKWIWAEPEQRSEQWEQLSEAALIPALCIASMVAVDIAAELTSHTFDRLLLGVDVKFGGPPSWIVGRLLRQHEWLMRACGWAYCSLPLALSVALLVQWRERRTGIRHAVDLRWVSVALGVTGFTLYQVCPAAGPVYLFRDVFPFGTPNLSGLAMVPAALASFPRNAMPSLHVGWTLLLYWNTRGRAWWVRVIVMAYLSLTVLATLGSGEHYLVDLMVAPALALAIQAACTARISITTRWVALCTGATLVLAWLIAFRTGAALAIPAGSAIWTLAVWTVLIPTVLKGSLGTKTEKHLRRAAAKRRLAA